MSPEPPVVGTSFGPSPLRTIEAAQVAAYAEASGDHNPIHLDADAARRAGLDGPILHGMLMMGMLEAPVLDWLPGYRLAWLQTRFMRPLAVGGSLSVSGRVVKLMTAPEGGLILRLMLKDGDGHALAVGEAELLPVT